MEFVNDPINLAVSKSYEIPKGSNLASMFVTHWSKETSDYVRRCILLQGQMALHREKLLHLK